MINMNGLSEFVIFPCACLLLSLTHACIGERSEAEDPGVREV